METQVISMCADLFNGDEKVRGNITSGGTESILLAIKTARDWAKKHKPNITKPEVIIPASAHPAFIKAFHYFGISYKAISLDNYKADVALIKEAITANTIMLVASAPSYPHGLMDPISKIASLAKKMEFCVMLILALVDLFFLFYKNLVTKLSLLIFK